MSKGSENKRDYTPVQKAFHWIIALGILVMIPLGIYTTTLEFGPQRLQLVSLHKSLGLTILVLVVLRLAWRWVQGTPPLPGHMARWEQWLARGSHILLYGLPMALPIIGWAYSSASGVATSWFGLITLPPILPESETLAHLVFPLHAWGGFLLAAVVAVHIAGALKHHIVNGDDVLMRMVPGGHEAAIRRRRSRNLAGEP